MQDRLLFRNGASRCKAEVSAEPLRPKSKGVTGRSARVAGAKTLMTVLRALMPARDRPNGALHVTVTTKAVDFRKGAEGLAAQVRETMTADPF